MDGPRASWAGGGTQPMAGVGTGWALKSLPIQPGCDSVTRKTSMTCCLFTTAAYTKCTWVTAFHAKRTTAVLTGPVIAGFCSLGSSHWVILLSVNNKINYIITTSPPHCEYTCFFFPYTFSLPFPQISISGLEDTAFTHLHQNPITLFSWKDSLKNAKV